MSTISLLQRNTSLILPILDESLDRMYGTCFRNGPALGTRASLEDFVGTRGVNIIVACMKQKCQFVMSLYCNPNTRCIEIYNVCKHLKNSSLSSASVMCRVLRYFIPDNPLFKGYTCFRLSVMCPNLYILPLLGSYTSQGFTVDSSPQPLSNFASNAFTMSKPLRDTPPQSMGQAVREYMRQCRHNASKRNTVCHAITSRLPKLDYTSNGIPHYNVDKVLKTLD